MAFIFLFIQFFWMDLGELLCIAKGTLMGKPWIYDGPMLPLYGSGAVSVLIITLPVRDNLPLVFIMGMIGATLLEFLRGWSWNPCSMSDTGITAI